MPLFVGPCPTLPVSSALWIVRLLGLLGGVAWLSFPWTVEAQTPPSRFFAQGRSQFDLRSSNVSSLPEDSYEAEVTGFYEQTDVPKTLHLILRFSLPTPAPSREAALTLEFDLQKQTDIFALIRFDQEAGSLRYLEKEGEKVVFEARQVKGEFRLSSFLLDSKTSFRMLAAFRVEAHDPQRQETRFLSKGSLLFGEGSFPDPRYEPTAPLPPSTTPTKDTASTIPGSPKPPDSSRPQTSKKKRPPPVGCGGIEIDDGEAPSDPGDPGDVDPPSEGCQGGEEAPESPGCSSEGSGCSSPFDEQRSAFSSNLRSSRTWAFSSAPLRKKPSLRRLGSGALLFGLPLLWLLFLRLRVRRRFRVS